MDCDDQVRLVKCDHDSYANTLNFAHEAALAIFVSVRMERIRDDPLDIRVVHP
jgi:hypothetical protein